MMRVVASRRLSLVIWWLENGCVCSFTTSLFSNNDSRQIQHPSQSDTQLTFSKNILSRFHISFLPREESYNYNYCRRHYLSCATGTLPPIQCTNTVSRNTCVTCACFALFTISAPTALISKRYRHTTAYSGSALCQHYFKRVRAQTFQQCSISC